MKSKSKLREGMEERVLGKVNKLKGRKGYQYFLSNIDYPENQKEQTKYLVKEAINIVEKNLPNIKKSIKAIKKHIPHIWDQNAITAAYLLLGKAYSNLETIILLSKEGCNIEIIDLARSGHESLDLVFLFLEEGDGIKLQNWFKGKIVDNKDAREKFHGVLTSELGNSSLPVYDVKTDIYGIYSLYTHSSYSALLDAVDVFHEDYDFERISGFHYTLRNYEPIIKNFTVCILLELKNIFIKYKDLENSKIVDGLLSEIGNPNASIAEIKETFDKYSQS